MMNVRRFFVLLVLLWLALTAGAQSPELLPDQPQRVTLGADQPLELSFSVGSERLWISLQARSLNPDDPLLDPVIWISDAEHQMLAYDNNGMVDDPINAHIPALLLPAAGTYRVFVDTFSGVGAGDVEVLLSLIDPFEPETPEEGVLRASLPAGEVFRLQLPVVAGDMLSLTVRDLSGTLDPVLRVLAEDGTLLIENDDHAGSDTTLNLLDARIVGWQVSTAQTVTVEVLDFLARSGQFELRIQHEATTNP
jgi:hypothetical protein